MSASPSPCQGLDEQEPISVRKFCLKLKLTVCIFQLKLFTYSVKDRMSCRRKFCSKFGYFLLHQLILPVGLYPMFFLFIYILQFRKPQPVISCTIKMLVEIDYLRVTFRIKNNFIIFLFYHFNASIYLVTFFLHQVIQIMF